MPRRRHHHDDPKIINAQVRTKTQTPLQQANGLMRQAETGALLQEEAVWEGGSGAQAGLLTNPGFLPAQRTGLAEQIGQVQGNRHLQGMLSTGGEGIQRQVLAHAIQRQGEPAAHPTIRYGSRGASVEEAQTKLNTAGATPPLAVDGIFGPLTRAAVVEFQTNNSLSPDGIVGPLTWGALDQVAPGPEPVPPEPVPPEPVPPEPAPRWTPDDQARLSAQTSSTGAINLYQASRAELRILAFSDTEYDTFRSILDSAGSDMEWAFLLKAAAAQRSLEDISTFADRIRGLSERWLMRNLMVVDLVNEMDPENADPEERGIMQQYGNSCGPTSVQLLHAQADPIYALELRSAGPVDQAPDQAVTNPDTIQNPQLASEQAGILNAHAAAGTGNAPSDRTAGGGGAWVESDMNALSNATGVTYTTQIIGSAITMDNAIQTLYDNLPMGVHVPIVVGGGTGASNTSHYVVVISVSGDRFLVHDVATGDTVWRTEDQFRNNTLNLPSGWNFYVAVDVPALVPPPLPAPPGPSGG
jgi:hypothetical protein